MVGFTGTQHGMTAAQIKAVAAFLTSLKANHQLFLYGMCVGADDQAAMIAGNLGYTLIGYPGNTPSKYGRVVPHFQHQPEPNLQRNRIIVRDASVLIATPREATMVQRSGTWATIRYARKAHVPVLLVHPDGTVLS